MGVQTFDAVRRPASDTTGAVEALEGVAALDVVALGDGELLREVIVGAQARCQLLHHTRRLEPPDGSARADAREPVQGRERLAVEAREGLDDRGEATGTPDGHPHIAADAAVELPLDGIAILA